MEPRVTGAPFLFTGAYLMVKTYKILILGGGTAGWMAANLMAKSWSKQGFSITLMESPDIPTVGVGEGSTPYIRRFFEQMDIPESEWMPQCHATYKNGIRFTDWTTKPGFESYFHPFATDIDNPHFNLFKQHVALRRQGLNISVHPDDYFLMTHMTKRKKLPLPTGQFSHTLFYAYHFDAKLLGDFLKKRALCAGVKYLVDKAFEIEKHPNGDIAAIQTHSNQRIEADFFVDCSGFSSLLMQKALDVPFISYRDSLHNDAAVAIPSAAEAPFLPQTLSAAMPCGWRWKIPLTHRTGNGYVYSSDHLSGDEAEQQLRNAAGINNARTAAHHIKMRVGRNQAHWKRNCLAVGLSQGFIEPLEATGLQMTLITIEQFIAHFEKGNFTSRYQENVNNGINAAFDHIRDYVLLHYLANNRNDTQYWRDCRGDVAISDSLRSILEIWSQGGDLEQELQRQNISQYYPSLSWHVILTGMGVFPSAHYQNPSLNQQLQTSKANMKAFFNHCVAQFQSSVSANQQGSVQNVY